MSRIFLGALKKTLPPHSAQWVKMNSGDEFIFFTATGLAYSWTILVSCKGPLIKHVVWEGWKRKKNDNIFYKQSLNQRTS